MNTRIKEIELNDDDSVKCFKLADGSTIEGDLYVSAMPGKSSGQYVPLPLSNVTPGSVCLCSLNCYSLCPYCINTQQPSM